MLKEIENIRNEEWYETLVDECKAIITETMFVSRYALIEGKHQVGERICNDSEYKKIAGGRGKHSILKQLFQDIGIGRSEGYACVSFFEKFPKLSGALDSFKEQKNISWNKIVQNYLPKPKEEKEIIRLPEGEFNVIYADPPWRYEFSETSTRDIENKYPTMELRDIKELKVPSAEDSILLLWATAPKLEEALEVMNAWGFKYRTCAVWDKEKIGMGYWFRGQHELLLLGIKGEFTAPEESVRYSSVIREKRTEHSKKPEKVYEMIETMFPKGKYLELFSRNKRKNWTGWGNDYE